MWESKDFSSIKMVKLSGLLNMGTSWASLLQDEFDSITISSSMTKPDRQYEAS